MTIPYIYRLISIPKRGYVLNAISIAIRGRAVPTLDRVYGLGRADLAVVAVAGVRSGGGGHRGVELGGEGAVVVVAVVSDVGDAEVVFACGDGVSLEMWSIGASLFGRGLRGECGAWDGRGGDVPTWDAPPSTQTGTLKAVAASAPSKPT
jgi:hypothetical protein